MLILAGTGELLDEVKQKTSSLNLDNKVLFLGNRSDVDRLYQAMDVFVLPSRYEGLGMVAIEAQMTGIHTIVSTEVPNDVKISNGVTFLSLNDDVHIWAVRIINNNGTVMVHKEAYNKFDISKQAAKLMKYYENI